MGTGKINFLLVGVTPYGKLPYLEIDGKVFCQSAAISKYLGKKAGIAGDNTYEEYNIDMSVDTVRDIVTDFEIVIKEDDPAKKEEKLAKFKGEILPPQLEKLDQHVKANGGFLANGKLSWGDLYAAAFFDFLANRWELDFSKYSNLHNLIKRVFNIPNIKAWIDKRPQDKRVI